MTGQLPERPVNEHPASLGTPIDRLGAYEDALRNIALLTLDARRFRRGDGKLDPLAGAIYLSEVESQLGALVAVGYVPPPEPDPYRRPLTAPPRRQ